MDSGVSQVIKVQGEVTERVVTEYRDRIKVVTKKSEGKT